MPKFSPSTDAQLKAAARITPSDIEAMQSFVNGLKRPIQFKVGKRIIDLPARVYRQFWSAPTE